MKKLKIMTIVGTRPEIIRLSRIIYKLDRHSEHYLVHTGQNYDYELNEIFFLDLQIRSPDYFLNASGNTSSETIGNVIITIEKLLQDLRPDAILILGDTNSGVSAIAAKRLKIPIFHMEAGNRCFDMRVPEEINRKIIDYIADVNLPYTSIAREYLLREGLPPDLIIKTGSPMFEVLTYYQQGIQSSNILERLGLSQGSFFLVSTHREENINSEKNFNQLIITLNNIAQHYHPPIIVSLHPRTEKRIKSQNVTFSPMIKLLKPLGFYDYNKLQTTAKAVLSDSGTITEESSILKFPALNIREAHERPEGMEEGAVMMVGLNEHRIMQGLNILENQSLLTSKLELIKDYCVPNVSEKIVRIIHSYVDYVNRVVWKKY